jgi:hypothetical protein
VKQQTLIDYEEASCSVLLAPFTAVRAAVQRVFSPERGTKGVTERVGPADLAAVYVGSPQRGGRFPPRALLYAPAVAPDRTVVFTDKADGWQTLTLALSREVPCTAWVFKVSRPSIDLPHYKYELIVNGETLRLVQLLKEGEDEWVFYQRGEPLDGEDLSRFNLKPRSRRLGYDDVLAMADRMGFPLREPGFWTSQEPGLYIELKF